MAKQLYPECTDVVIDKIILRNVERMAYDIDDRPIGLQPVSYVIVTGRAVDASGDRIAGQDIHEKVYLEPAVLWTPQNVRKEAGNLLKEALKGFKKAYKDKADVDVNP